MKNEYEIRGDITAIFINSPKYGLKEALISTSKLERVKEFQNSWRLNYNKNNNTFYVTGTMPMEKGNRQHAILHRWLTEAQKGTDVDHFNHSGLDNTDANLRITTHSENIQNRRGAQTNSKSGIRGVCWNTKHEKWVAQIVLGGKQKYLGCFNDINEAERIVIEARARLMPFSQEASA